MDRQVIVSFLGRMLVIFGLVFLFPLACAFIYSESLNVKLSYLASGLLSVGIGLLIGALSKKGLKFNASEGLVACALSWIALSAFGALPLYLTGEAGGYINAFFEISSGLTTTGASVIPNVEGLSHASLLWRAFTHFIGGMGVLVFAFIFIPKVDADGVFLLRAEMTGPNFGKLTSSLKSTAKILYSIYLGMTVILVVLLLICGMPLFDSLCHAFATAGTGGFSIKNSSIGFYNSPAIEWVIGSFMLFFGINFNLFYLLLMRKFKMFFEDEELHWYFGIVFLSVLFIFANIFVSYQDKIKALRDSFFSVATVISTTGFGTADFSNWPPLSRGILFILMFFGGMAGSTAGGIKISRLMMCLKGATSELKRQREPGRMVPVFMNKKPVSQNAYKPLFGYMAMYFLIFVVLFLILANETKDFISAISASTAIFNNIGPGFNQVGPSGNYLFFSPVAKLAMSLAMIAGRLEIWPVVALFYFKKRSFKHI